MPRFQRQTFRNSARPNRSWARIVSTALINVPAASKVLLSTGVLDNQGIDETILRSVGLIAVATDAPGASESQIGAFGMIVVTDLAAAAGAASIPGPVTDGFDDGWLTYVPIAQEWDQASQVGRQQAAVQYHFDSKAKRVVSTGSSIAFMVENAHATFAFDILINMRMLTQVRGTR